VTRPLRIANCSGFYGDRLSAAREMVEGGPIDVLTGDWLAELTMLILARTQAKQPGGGFAKSFVRQMEEVMGTCMDKGIKVVSNAGGLDPDHCAQAVADVADKLGLSPKIAYVNGDNLLPRLEELQGVGVNFAHLDTGDDAGDLSRFITANAYLGCFGIVEALRLGADIIITGRVTDAAIVCGPAAWHHNWGRDQWDALAGAVVAGHVIECGAQASGGNYSFFTEIANMHNIGFPWAEIAEDGSSVIGKHDGTGGEVSIGTVTSQLLYEIASPTYLGPDVSARFDTILLEQLEKDRVRISNVKGEPPPPTLKVAMNEVGGFRKDLNIALTGSRARTLRETLTASRHASFAPTNPIRPPTKRPSRSGTSPSRITTKRRSAALSPTPPLKSHSRRRPGSSTWVQPRQVVRRLAFIDRPWIRLNSCRNSSRFWVAKRRSSIHRHRRERPTSRLKMVPTSPCPRERRRNWRSANFLALVRVTREATPTSGCSLVATKHGRGSTPS
jgi:hypothetical protein